jgi:hypothetical protein
MGTEYIVMKGSTCPICKSRMFVDHTNNDSLLVCSFKDCDYNNQEKREAYFKEKRTKLIVGDVLHKTKNGTRLMSRIKNKDTK